MKYHGKQFLRSKLGVFLFLCAVLALFVPFPASAEDQTEAPPTKDPSNRLSSMTRMTVREFEIEGNTAFSDEELSKITDPYENRPITSEELQDLRRKLTLYYVERGYISSGAIIPDQQVTDGKVTLRVIEGKLSRIEIVGNKHFRSSYIRKRLTLAAKPPVNIRRLQQALQRLEQDPRIKRINAEFSPGAAPGESELKVSIEEKRPYRVGIEGSNTESPSIGGERAGLILSHENLTGNGDILAGNFGVTEGLSDIDVSYLFPVTARDATVMLQYRKNDSVVIEAPFQDLEIESKTDTYGLTVRQPFYIGSDNELALGLIAERRHGETFLDDRPYNFLSGSQDKNDSNVTVLRLFQEWIDRSQKQVIAARSTFNMGIEASGITLEGEADDNFFFWLGQFQWIRRLGDSDWQTVLRTDAQLSGDSLLPLEKFSIGGMDSVRGYRENRLVRDNGVASSLELRIPVFRNEQRGILVQLAPFADYGASWNTDFETPHPKTLSSVGLGLRCAVGERFNFQIYGGIPLRKFDNYDEDIQDLGIHFRFAAFLF